MVGWRFKLQTTRLDTATWQADDFDKVLDQCQCHLFSLFRPSIERRRPVPPQQCTGNRRLSVKPLTDDHGMSTGRWSEAEPSDRGHILPFVSSTLPLKVE
ncbi:hypothetical protein M514_03236 [Trichuris suis]|uniref:Uncharacterized protein n=1 Tax=Trichuris suis TaxID=68888 RepID=A0A085MF01_9BILA|nr:hypothetical protein M513_03236 [Trichuris suis]KFD61754.1 hypothetical protein M514_03236 [Trichuris suis]